MPKLGDLAEIYSGFAVQGAIKPDPDGNVWIVRPVDADSRGVVDWGGVARISINSKKKYRALAVGDVLFRSVGTANPTCLVGVIPDDRPAIAHQHFLHIRLHDDGWDPAFLALLLNSERMQTYFRGQASGATQGIVRRGVLEQFELPEIALDHQQGLVACWSERCTRIEQLRREIEVEERKFTGALDALCSSGF